MAPRDEGLIIGWGWCIWGGCSKAAKASTSRLRVRDVLAQEQAPGMLQNTNSTSFHDTNLGVGKKAATANSNAIVAVLALLSFFVGLAISVLIIARVIKGRGRSERQSLVADQQWLSGTGKGTSLLYMQFVWVCGGLMARILTQLACTRTSSRQIIGRVMRPGTLRGRDVVVVESRL